MARRVRPKTRPRPSAVDESQNKRIKIRMRRDSSDSIESLILQARKEAAKEANFKGFKAGVKSGTSKQKKKTEEVSAQLVEQREKAAMLEGRLYAVERVLTECIIEKPEVVTLLAAKGLRMSDTGTDFTARWVFQWDTVVRDMDGVDRVTSALQRHRLHPGARIPVREMWDLWNALTVNERPDLDPMQGTRGAWYYNERRYSTHSSAMNAWRRHMHNKYLNSEPHTIPEPGTPHNNPRVPGAIEPDEAVEYRDEDEFGTPFATGTDPANVSRRRNNMRNRINRVLRSHELNPVSYWTRHYTDNQGVIDTEAYTDLSPFNRVCSWFAVPLEEWDDVSWTEFRQDISYYLEVLQNSGETAAGTPSTRRRSGRRRESTRYRAARGYNRDNY